jgi:NurA-like 5'-3' nuclease
MQDSKTKDIKTVQQQLKDQGLLNSDEAIVLMRVLAGEPITPQMLGSLPNAIAKIVPDVMKKLVEEYIELLDKNKELVDKMEKSKSSQDNEKELYLQLLADEKLEESKLAMLPTHAHKLIQSYQNVQAEIAKHKDKFASLQKDIEKQSSQIAKN